MTAALTDASCKILHQSSPDRAPFILSFETPSGERMAIVAYAFLATRTPTKNRPDDERSFQIKYGSKAAYADDNSHELWQDPLGMFTTLLVGIDPVQGTCISADPIIHTPTKFFIRLEFKDDQAEAVVDKSWYAWQRIKRNTPIDAPRVETLVGATKDRFLDLVRFERAARGLDPGNRLILAESKVSLPTSPAVADAVGTALAAEAASHPLVEQFKLSSNEILDLIANSRRLKMAVRGWVAEEHLRETIAGLSGITHCERLDGEGGPDLTVGYQGGPPLFVECKNVSRETDRFGNPKIDFQRTRAAKGNPCSRYYEPSEFDIVAACLHNVTAVWDFRFSLSAVLPPHKSCIGRITSNIKVDKEWFVEAHEVFLKAYAARGVSL